MPASAFSCQTVTVRGCHSLRSFYIFSQRSTDQVRNAYTPAEDTLELTHNSGIGPIPSIYFSEAFPLSHREIGAAFTICVNNGVGSVLGLTFPSLLKAISPTGGQSLHSRHPNAVFDNCADFAIAFGLYAGLCIVAFVVIFLFIPETKLLSLEELDYVFGVSMIRHASYQVRTWLPWWIKRWIFWRRDLVLEPLYRREAI